MIIELFVVHPFSSSPIHIRYYDYLIDPDTITRILDEITEHNPLERMSTEEYVAYFIQKDCPDGLYRSFGIVIQDGVTIVVVGDEIEEADALVGKAVKVRSAIRMNFDTMQFVNLSRRRRARLVELINEAMLDYSRIVLFGDQKTGKTSICELVAEGRIVENYTPSTIATIVPDIGVYSSLVKHDDFSEVDDWFIIANRIVTLYDLPGSKHHRHLWQSYLSRADIGVIVLESSKKGVIQGKKTMLNYRRMLPETVVAIATFQDHPGVIAPIHIAKFLGVTTYPVVANDIDSREQLRDLIRTIALLRFYE